MEFWLKHTNSDKFMFPVNPEEFFFTEKHINTSVNVVKLGEINLLGKRGLKEGVLTSFFPAKEYNFSNNAGLQSNPYWYINKMLEWKNNNTPVQLIVGGGINETVTIESLKYGEQDATGDVYFSVTLKEYRKIEKKKQTKKKAKKKKVTPKKKTTKKKKKTTNNKPKAKTYTVKSGDCLWNIAKKYYGNGAQYTKIYNANKGTIKNPNLIYPGMKLKIP